jgi:hypothetical protein
VVVVNSFFEHAQPVSRAMRKVLTAYCGRQMTVVARLRRPAAN